MLCRALPQPCRPRALFWMLLSFTRFALLYFLQRSGYRQGADARFCCPRTGRSVLRIGRGRYGDSARREGELSRSLVVGVIGRRGQRRAVQADCQIG